MCKRIVVGVILGSLAVAAGQAGQQQPDLRKPLSDPNPQVRLEAALALAEQQDQEAIGVLIDLLADLPPAQSRRAEQALQQLAEEWAPNPALTGADEVSRRIRRDAWAAWWRNTDGPALLAAFRKRTLTEDETEKIKTLIATLSDKTFAKRERATADLVAVGLPVVPLLRLAMHGADLEQTYRLEKCLKLIAKSADQDVLPAAAARLLALRRPAGATEALLAYVPFTDDEVMKWEVAKALQKIARSGKLDPVLTKTLADTSPVRRAMAAQVLAGAGAEHRGAVRKLLADPDPVVRLRVAVALICSGDKEAVAALIDVTAELPRDQVWQADEMLHRLAGAQAPPAEPEDWAAARHAYRDAWKAWWKKHAALAKLAPMDLPPPHLGFTVIAAVNDMNRGNSRVLEIDRHGKIRWQFNNVNFPADVHVLDGNRVLISEHYGSRITERDFHGNVIWEKNELPAKPYNVQRLANGNTFVAMANNLMEFDRAGKTVVNLSIVEDLVAACKLPDGQILYLPRYDRKCIRLDAAGKVMKSFPSIQDGNTGYVLDVTPRGHALVTRGSQSAVEEFDLEGKSVWKVMGRGMATAVRNGHVVMASYEAGQVSELDRAGNTVWQYQPAPGYNPFLARQR